MSFSQRFLQGSWIGESPGTLIPAHGAVGACIGSGVAQMTAVGIMWAVGIRVYNVKLPWVLVAKVAFISTLAALTAHFVAATAAPVCGDCCLAEAHRWLCCSSCSTCCAYWSRKTRPALISLLARCQSGSANR